MLSKKNKKNPDSQYNSIQTIDDLRYNFDFQNNGTMSYEKNNLIISETR